MATKETKQTADTSAADISKKMKSSASFNANELQKVQIYSIQRKGYTFYEFILLNQRVALDRSLVNYLKQTDAFKQTLQLEPWMQLYGIRNGEYCNLHIGFTKEKRDELNAVSKEDPDTLPF